MPLRLIGKDAVYGEAVIADVTKNGIEETIIRKTMKTLLNGSRSRLVHTDMDNAVSHNDLWCFAVLEKKGFPAKTAWSLKS